MATTDEGVVTPPLSNAPNVPADMQAMATSVTKKVIPQFASTAARVISAPVDGQMTYQQDSRRLERFWATTSSWSPFLTARVQMKRTGSVQSIPNNSLTGVTWDGVEYNPGGVVQSGSGVTIPTGVTYVDVRASVEFVANATGRRFMCVLKNGAEYTAVNRTTVASNTASNGTGLNLPGLSIAVTAGDVINIGVFQDSGAALNMSIGATMLIVASS